MSLSVDKQADVIDAFNTTFRYLDDILNIKRKRELVALLNLSSWCLVMVERLFLAVTQGCLWFVIVVFTDHTHLLLLIMFIFTIW